MEHMETTKLDSGGTDNMEVATQQHTGDLEADGREKCDGRHSSDPSTLGQGTTGSLVASMAGVLERSLDSAQSAKEFLSAEAATSTNSYGDGGKQQQDGGVDTVDLKCAEFTSSNSKPGVTGSHSDGAKLLGHGKSGHNLGGRVGFRNDGAENQSKQNVVSGTSRTAQQDEGNRHRH
jgi:hypothetical protein